MKFKNLRLKRVEKNAEKSTDFSGNKSRGILKYKFYLYLTEFFSGMSVMAVELGASRLLAPYFSSSQIVWTIIIGTIMIAMALGNIYGGKSADKKPDPDRLYRRILISALWIAAIPFFGKFIILGVSALLVVTVSTNFLICAAFISCMAIFVFPLFLLGTVTPSLVKYTVESLDESGKTVGTLNASNTIGSIIGTFVPTFISIPAAGTAATFLIFSGILLVLGLVYFVSYRRKIVICIISALLFAVFSVLSSSIGFAFWEKQLVYEGESVYNYLQVTEDEARTYLSTNVLFGVQSIYVKSGELSGFYYDYAMAAPVMSGDAGRNKDILILGMGTGTYATQCGKYFEGVNIEGVEIDEKITFLAREYFELPESVMVTTYDGRAYLNVSDKKYDVIMVDAYQDITIPFQMSTVEFFGMVKEHLTENGVMVVNMNMKSSRTDSINDYLVDTIASVFEEVYTVDVPNATNRELFASDNADMTEELKNNADMVGDPKLSSILLYVSDHLIECRGGENVLTDNKAPVELLGMKMIDDIIRDELSYYKKLFKEQGIKGLLG